MLTLLASALFIFGPSCGGKSTLCKALMERLGPSWIHVDRDVLIEEEHCTEERADEAIEELLLLHKDADVLIDVQVPWRAPQKGQEAYVLVFAPLSELLKRDEQRTIKLNRSPKRAHYARLYVEETLAKVFQTPEQYAFCYDLLLDSSHHSLEAEIDEVLNLLKYSAYQYLGGS